MINLKKNIRVSTTFALVKSAPFKKYPLILSVVVAAVVAPVVVAATHVKEGHIMTSDRAPIDNI